MFTMRNRCDFTFIVINVITVIVLSLHCVQGSGKVQLNSASVPLLAWNLISRPDLHADPFTLMSSESLRDGFHDVTFDKNVVLFVQGRLSIEDFLTGNMNSLQKYLTPGTSFYLPAAEGGEALGAAFSSSLQRWDILGVEGAAKFDFNGTGNLIVVHLEATCHADCVVEIFEKLKEKDEDIVAMFTGQSPSNKVSVKSRSKRAADGDTTNKPVLFNNDDMVYVYSARQPTFILYWRNVTACKTVGKANSSCPFDQLASFDIPNDASHLDTGEKHEEERSISVKYKSIPEVKNSTLKLRTLTIIMMFEMMPDSYWRVNNMSVEFTATNGGTDISEKTALFVSIPEIPAGFSYHCSSEGNFRPDRSTKSEQGYAGGVKFYNFQVDPFVKNGTFNANWDCNGFFTAPIWVGILATLGFALIVAWGLKMLANIRTMDRFDDPKGKTISVPTE